MFNLHPAFVVSAVAALSWSATAQVNFASVKFKVDAVLNITPGPVPFPTVKFEGRPINVDGYVAGTMEGYYGSGLHRAFVWGPDGSRTELPIVPGRDKSRARSITDNGKIVGWMGVTSTGQTGSGAVWTPGPGGHMVTAIPSLGGPSSFGGGARCARDSGWIGLDESAALGWRMAPNGVVEQLSGAQVVGDISSTGVAVGWSWPNGLRWVSPTAPQSLDKAGHFAAYPIAINESGQVAGYIQAFNNSLLAAGWSASNAATLLPTPAGTNVNSRATGLDEYGVTVGWATSNSWPQHGILWDASGKMYLVKDLLAAGQTVGGAAVTNVQQVLGIASDKGSTRLLALVNLPSNGTAYVTLLAEAPCYADCDLSGSLDFFDFLCFQNEFNLGTAYADCDASGSLDFFDFLCFQNEFNNGCP